MKLIIDIPDNEYKYTCDRTLHDRSIWDDAIRNGIPLDDVKAEQFAEWVATEIFDDMWEYNKDSFAEIACRKLAKLGIVRAKGNEWELFEPQESEEV